MTYGFSLYTFQSGKGASYYGYYDFGSLLYFFNFSSMELPEIGKLKWSIETLNEWIEIIDQKW